MQCYDAHCHLQDERPADRLETILERAREAGVTRMVCCGTCETDWPRVAELANRYPQIIPCFGLHPWFLDDRSSQWHKNLRSWLEKYPAGVGEIGLDHAIKAYNPDEQEAIFRTQLELARELKRPVSIHCRRAWGKITDILRGYGLFPEGILMHSFSGSVEIMELLQSINAYFSFSGAITLSNNKRAQRMVRAVPADRLLSETDAPDIPPVLPDHRRAKLSEPAHVRLVVQHIATLRNITATETARITTCNAERLFGNLHLREMNDER
jgi:TatD DNase family protein